MRVLLAALAGAAIGYGLALNGYLPAHAPPRNDAPCREIGSPQPPSEPTAQCTDLDASLAELAATREELAAARGEVDYLRAHLRQSTEQERVWRTMTYSFIETVKALRMRIGALEVLLRANLRPPSRPEVQPQ